MLQIISFLFVGNHLKQTCPTGVINKSFPASSSSSLEVCRTVSVRALSCAPPLPEWRPHHPGHQLVQLHQPLEPQSGLHHRTPQSPNVSGNCAKRNCHWQTKSCSVVPLMVPLLFPHQEPVKWGCVCCTDQGECSSHPWGDQRPPSKDLQAFPAGPYSSECHLGLTDFCL